MAVEALEEVSSARYAMRDMQWVALQLQLVH